MIPCNRSLFSIRNVHETDLRQRQNLLVQCHVINKYCDDTKIVRRVGHEYFIGDTRIESSEAERDLGVCISTDCKPSQHVQQIAKKASGVLAQLKRSVLYRDTDVFPRASLERTSGPFWRPHLPCGTYVAKREDINLLEKVQRRAMKCEGSSGCPS